MERTRKQKLAAAVAAVALVVLLVLAGGRLSGQTLPASQDALPAQQTDAGSAPDTADSASDAIDPNDSAITGEAGGDNRAVSGISGQQDPYHTDPVPEGRPEPVEPDSAAVDTGSTLHCTISISCDTILNNMELCRENKRALVPSDGVILSAREVTFSSGESVYDVLQRACRDNGIHMEASFTPTYNSYYIEGIHNLYEFDVGGQSGWMYKVNGWFPNYGCSRYQVQNGDVICWVYTCDLGADVGDNSMSG